MGQRPRQLTIIDRGGVAALKVRVDTPSETDTYAKVMDQFIDDYNDQAKLAFFKRIPSNLAVFLRQREYN